MDLYLGARERRRGLARAIYEQVREAIAEGRVRAGEKLPPTRELARQLGVSRFTVTTAYGFLVAEGFLAGATGAGTRVAIPASPSYRRGPAPRRSHLAPLPTQTRPRLDLSLGCPDPDLFPSTEWRGHVRRALRDAHRVQYGDPAGDPRLRTAIATWIHRSRGVRAAPGRVVVSAGAQQAFDLILGTLVAPGDVVAVEDPGYLPFRTLAQARGAKIVPVPVDREGLIVGSLPSRARLVHVTPSHQFPLGPVLSLARRRQLLEWARSAGAHVIEDDYDTEFRFSDRPLEPLSRLDTSGRVIYVGSFSKTLSPTLRLGFMVVPDELVASLAGLRQVVDWCSPVFLQRALAGFISDGSMDRHLRRARRVYRARHQLVVDWLAGPGRELGRLVHGDAGLHVAVETSTVDEAQLIRGAAERGLAIDGLSHYSVESGRRGLALGYGAASTASLTEALPMLLTLGRGQSPPARRSRDDRRTRRPPG